MKIKSLGLIFYLSLIVQACGAADYYVSRAGDDLNNGAGLLTPFATIEKALAKAVPGDTVFLRGGKYDLSARINIAKSGTPAAAGRLMAYKAENPILDFTKMPLGENNQGVYLSGDYWHIKGIHIKGAGNNGIKITGDNNLIENCKFYENRDSGLQLDKGASNNRIVNCDSYYNADPARHANADGFAVKLDVGSGNYFYGCRAWLNCDDGWDGYLRGADNVSTTIINCWAFRNGYMKDGSDAGPDANGNGFKLGGSDDKTLCHNFIVKNCFAFDNKSKGFTQNQNTGSMALYNCTGYHNLADNYWFAWPLAAGKSLIVKNCVALGYYGMFTDSAVLSNNSWARVFVTTEKDFASIDTTEAFLPRKPDGSLPDIKLMRLAPGSDLIDSGCDVGIPYKGKAPDLGAWERQ